MRRDALNIGTDSRFASLSAAIDEKVGAATTHNDSSSLTSGSRSPNRNSYE